MASIPSTLTAMIVLLGCTAAATAQTARDDLTVYAAGSLRAAMTDLARAFERETPTTVKLTFGASGLLKDRIEGGEAAQVFASANMSHPEALRASGKAEAVSPFARNALCVLASSTFSLQGKALAQRLLDSDIRVGTSTPRADPSGDYAFQMFERIESTGAASPGSASALKAKALQLTGGPTSPQPPAGRNLYGMLVEQGKADVFVTYCTNAAEAKQQFTSLQVLPIPDAINVSAVYGMATVQPAGPTARAFVNFVISPAGQKILGAFGFSAP
jgi:ABC-type molybdate transport system substrate-binding protein